MFSDKNRVIACSSMLIMLLLFAASIIIGMDRIAIAEPASKKSVIELPRVGSMENLKKLLSQSDESRYNTNETALMKMKQTTGNLEGRNYSKSASAATDQSTSYSQTNVQAQEVDEADMVKTDGEYIYQVNKQQILIVKARPASEMKIISRLSFDDPNFSPMELYLDSNNLVVVGSSSIGQPAEPPNTLPEKAKRLSCPPAFSQQSTCQILVYDISNKAAIKKTRELELEGDYLSSRKIGSAVYLVSNRHIPYYHIQDLNLTLPAYRDSAIGSTYNTIDCNHISYFPDNIYPAFIITAGFNLGTQEKADVKTYLGNGENLYASDKNLYIAISRYTNQVRPLLKDSVAPANPAPASEQTNVFKFALVSGNISYHGKSEVPGRILNQFSMDENGDYFRIATTSGDMWRNDEYTSQNNLYVLDEALNICGKLENLAPGEKIYSTRFMGDRAYMVTFKNVDPLFVIDLKDPLKPTVLGKLKIPGYSDYLHPYDENHLIGFGKESIELKTGTNESQAYYQGMKIALFDVSDVSHPQEMFKQTIGDRGTDSELLHNHKALLFSKEKNLLAFPVTLMEIDQNNIINPQGFPEYGSFSFQGAYVYNLELSKGFQLKGRITHLNDSDYNKAGDKWYDSDKNVERIIYIGDTLYTLSPSMIKASNLPDLKQTGNLDLR
ncbi:MAG: beta-propeller domain-containing protein [Syntrophomonadaceae bacterium]|nr:beta-propeller domain-containing protein [Syntrophomonadaceae bacterium]